MEFVPGQAFVPQFSRGGHDRDAERQTAAERAMYAQQVQHGGGYSGPPAEGYTEGYRGQAGVAEFVPGQAFVPAEGYRGLQRATEEGFQDDGAELYGLDGGWGAGAMGGWFEHDSTPHSVVDPNLMQQMAGVTVVACDRHEELIWSADAMGYITALCCSLPEEAEEEEGAPPPPPECIVSVRGHRDSVLAMCPNRHGVLSVSSTRVAFHTRGGMLKHEWSTEGLRTCCFGDRDMCYVAGENNRLLQLSLSKGQLLRDQALDSGVSCMHADRSTVVCGGSDGRLIVRDTRTMKPTLTLQAHSHSILDLDMKANTVVTCGYQRRFDRATQQMGAAEDRFIHVYDVRHTRRELSQIPVATQPYQLRFHPNFSATVVVLSSTGAFHQCDIGGGALDLIEYQIESDGDFVSSFDVSSSGEVLAFGDSGGFVHRWVDRQPFTVNQSSQPTERVDRGPEAPSFELEINDPSASMPVVHLYSEDQGALFSEMRARDWSSSRVGQPPRTIGPEVLARVEQRDAIGVVRPVPDGFVRNSTMGSLSWKHVTRAKAKAALAAFSPGAITMAADGTPPPQAGGPFAADGTTLKRLFSPGQAVKMRRDTYVRINLKIKQLEGVGGFQFEKYNRTHLTGLENALPNSYTNPLLQLLYFTPALRATMLNRLSREEVCLCDELHFLFEMMDDPKAVACFSNNFLRAFRQLRPPLNLVASEDTATSMDDRTLATRIINCLQYFLEHTHKELLSTERDTVTERDRDSERLADTDKAQSQTSTVVSELFCAKVLTVHTEPKSNTVWTREDNVFVHSLVYPPVSEDIPVCFEAALQRSLCREQSLRTYVPGDNSQTPQRVHQKKVIAALPPSLVINCGFPTEGESKTGRLKWLRSRRSVEAETAESDDMRPMSMCSSVRVTLRTAEMTVSVEENRRSSPAQSQSESSAADAAPGLVAAPEPEPEPESEPQSTGEVDTDTEHGAESADYELTGIICLVHDPMKKESSHGGNIVAILKIPTGTLDEGTSSWFVFNDFRIEEVSEDEALQLCGSWKIPCILVYSQCERDSAALRELVAVPKPVDHRENLTAYMNDFTATIRRTMHERTYSFTPLAPDELQRGNLMVAIDAEFVALSHEVTSTREDGSRVTIIPARFGLARVSVIRGDQGPMEGVPIMDHYISSPEPVADYLTKYSGVEPGDLDPNVSRHYVTTLKAAYLQLKWFTAAGCTFVGHGLKKVR